MEGAVSLGYIKCYLTIDYGSLQCFDDFANQIVDNVIDDLSSVYHI